MSKIKPKRLRFAFDLGTGSLGWAVFELDEAGKPKRLVALGSRIFSTTEAGAGREANGDSKAKVRRTARAMRRGYDRRLQRYAHVSDLLIKMGLFPDDETERAQLCRLSPHELRAKALSEELPLHHVGRAIWHINKHRGFKSNRKTDDPSEKGKISSAAERLKETMDEHGTETYGAFLAQRQANTNARDRQPTRIRQNSDKTADLYEFYPLRDMLIEEFDLICIRQAERNPGFPDGESVESLRSAVFFHRPLKEVKPGFCSFYPEEERLMKAHPDAEEFVLYQKVNEIRITDDDGYQKNLDKPVRDEIMKILLSGKDVTWSQLRKILGLGKSEGQISLEEGDEKKLVGSAMAHRFKVGNKKKPAPFPQDWDDIRNDPDRLKRFLEIYRTANTDKELRDGLLDLGLTEDQAKGGLACSLPDGHLHISHKAVRKILPELKTDVITYAEACARAGLHHSDKRDGEVFDTLPYYNEIDGMKRFLGHSTGNPNDPRDVRYGRIANPTVHVGLNQLRRLINALINRYGRPDEIVLELSRELKKNKKQKDKLKKDIGENRKANDARRADLEKMGFYQKGDRIRTREAFRFMRLWEELGENPLDRVCPYSGKPITSLSVLLSDEIEIEHILPRSRTLDDSMANKTVAYREWNRLKRNLSPAEAAERFPEKFNLNNMMRQAKNMPTNKRWRFQPNAMKDFEEKGGFAERLLKETQHFGVVARHYLSKLAPANRDQREMKVWVTSGRLTAELRRKWGLHLGTNEKNRNDHRHHALDAAVIGVTDRGLINRLSREAARDEENEVRRILADIDDPYDGFSDEVNNKARAVIVSHRPNHRVAGQIHGGSNYGKVDDNPTNRERGDMARGNLVIRRDLLSLTPKMIGQVRDPKIRAKLESVLDDARQLSGGGETDDFKEALLEGLKGYQRDTGTRRVRCLYPKDNAVPLGTRQDKRGNFYKYAEPEENLYVDIFELSDGTWKAVWVSIFDAYHAQRTSNQRAEAKRQGDAPPQPPADHPEAKFIMRLYKGDTLQLLGADDVNEVKVVHELRAKANTVALAGHKEAGKLDGRHKDKNDSFRWDFTVTSKLKVRRARRVRVDETGRIRTIPHGKHPGRVK